MNIERDRSTEAVRDYWDQHTLGKQYVKRDDLAPGTREFFDHVRPWMSPFKFSWIMDRINREAAIIGDGRVLEIGCGMGFTSLEFSKRGCSVTATDLTPSAIEITRQHYEIENAVAEDVRVENVLDLSFDDKSFDAVWANGVLHHTGDARKGIQEIRRVLKPNGRAIISHFYRRPSWMYWLSRLGRENIEFKAEDPPVTDFLTEKEILRLFEGYQVESTAREHYRALPIAKSGLKAFLYTWLFAPLYNLIPRLLAEKLAYKFSVTAIRK